MLKEIKLKHILQNLLGNAGGASGGDDALAMTLSHLLKTRIQWIYLISDLLVLGLSLSYIPLNKIIYSLLTVVLSGQIVGWVQMAGRKSSDLQT